MMLLEMDMDSDDLFGEDGDEDEDDSDDFGDEDSSEEEKLDIYEFDDVDPEIFRDPTLMVKWLNKQWFEKQFETVNVQRKAVVV